VPLYNSCRNRHCPKCQSLEQARWVEQQVRDLLPVHYFHVVFTVPACLQPLFVRDRRQSYALLLAAVWETLREVCRRRPGATPGAIAVLHTWSQTLTDHIHLHCIVTGGGVALEGTRWVSSSAHYLFPVQALSVMFRGKFLAGLKALFDAGQLEFHGQLAALAKPSQFATLIREAAAPEWVVYAKRPFAGLKQVLAYLSRYTHRVAISNRRLIWADGQNVTFAYKDYTDAAKQKTMTLSTEEFVRRFCLHILPERFVKIRHYGLLGNRHRQQRLAKARQLLGISAAPRQAETSAPKEARSESLRARCPFCQRPSLVLVREVAPQRAARLIVRLDSS
jgi:hypothetical protein